MIVPFPFALRPMLLNQRRQPFDSADWLFEPKWDGWRALAVVQDGRATRRTRGRVVIRLL